VSGDAAIAAMAVATFVSGLVVLRRLPAG